MDLHTASKTSQKCHLDWQRNRLEMRSEASACSQQKWQVTVQDALALHALEKLSEACFACTKVFYAPDLSIWVHGRTIMHLYVHDPICHECMRPGSKDHLALTTAFACTVGWSLKPGFTVVQDGCQVDNCHSLVAVLRALFILWKLHSRKSSRSNH